MDIIILLGTRHIISHGAMLKYFQQFENEELRGVNISDWIAWLEKQGEKNPADKIAPKFHEGDWIISNNKKSIYQVIEVKRGIYVVRDNADNHEYHIGIEECEKSGRLWTIQDAKDDDVLVHNGITFIFKGIEDGIVKGLCSELSDSILNFGEPEHDKDYYPATKEQRDTLFTKMKEAGYEWDAERKELNKIENHSLLSDFFNAEYATILYDEVALSSFLFF